jgi:hypothetical protein
MKAKIRYGEKSHSLTQSGVKHFRLHFVCGQDVDCDPPYVKGARDAVWASGKVNLFSKEDVERVVGMQVLPYPNEEN